MEKQLIDVLKNLGLSEKEAKVYLACVERGTAVVSDIAQAAKINRVTTYDILEKLKQKGLVSYFTKKKLKFFNAIAPENLLEEYEKRTSDLRTSLPKFKTLTGEINHPRVRYFEGLEGIKAIYADTLTSKTEILNYSNSLEIRNQWPNYDEEYVSKRAKKGIYLRGIAPKDKAGESVHAKDQKFNRELRLIPSDQFDFTNEINIYDDKVAIISFKDELIGMIIESSEIANSQRAIFNMCWQFAEKMGIKTKLLEPLKQTEIVKAAPATVAKNDEASDKNLSLF
ncbi:MAG: helix-turn-helix domain-containing protein [Patescibacteria group bacterium]